MSQQPILLHMVRSAKPSPTLHPSFHNSNEKVTYPHTHTSAHSLLKRNTYCKPLFTFSTAWSTHQPFRLQFTVNTLFQSSKAKIFCTPLQTRSAAATQYRSGLIGEDWISCNSIFILWKPKSWGLNHTAQIQKHMKSVRLWLVGCRATNLTNTYTIVTWTQWSPGLGHSCLGPYCPLVEVKPANANWGSPEVAVWTFSPGYLRAK